MYSRVAPSNPCTLHSAPRRIRRLQGSPLVGWVVVGAALSLSKLQTQQRLRAVQRLNLPPRAHAEHQGVVRRVHIKTHGFC